MLRADVIDILFRAAPSEYLSPAERARCQAMFREHVGNGWPSLSPEEEQFLTAMRDKILTGQRAWAAEQMVAVDAVGSRAAKVERFMAAARRAG